MKLTYDTMVRAMTESDASFDGKFYTGVHSTKIYCVPSCKAKLPLLKNVIFYSTREEAIAAGLRGCLKCRSETFPDVLPSWLHKVIKVMRENQGERLDENRLMKISGVEISTIRRYFKSHLNQTPLAFHRRIRLNYASRLLESGVDYLGAAYDCGYESVSGFREAFARQFGHTPGRHNDV